MYPLAGFCGNEERRSPGSEIEFLADFFAKPAHGVCVFLYCVPLVHHEHQPPAFFDHISGDVGVLGRDAFCGVDQHESHIRPLDCPHGSNHAVLLQPGFDGSPLPDAGRIHQDHFLPLPRDFRVHGVPGGSRDFADYRPFCPHQGVEQRGFAHVRPPNDRQVQGV